MHVEKLPTEAAFGLAVALGTLTSNFNTLTVALNGNATDAAVKALAEAIKFQNTLSNAITGTRRSPSRQ